MVCNNSHMQRRIPRNQTRKRFRRCFVEFLALDSLLYDPVARKVGERTIFTPHAQWIVLYM